MEHSSGTKVDLDLQFTAENGYQVPLRQLFQKGKPVLLNFVYYRCPMLCNLVLNGQTAALAEIWRGRPARVRDRDDQHRPGGEV